MFNSEKISTLIYGLIYVLTIIMFPLTNTVCTSRHFQPNCVELGQFSLFLAKCTFLHFRTKIYKLYNARWNQRWTFLCAAYIRSQVWGHLYVKCPFEVHQFRASARLYFPAHSTVYPLAACVKTLNALLCTDLTRQPSTIWRRNVDFHRNRDRISDIKASFRTVLSTTAKALVYFVIFMRFCTGHRGKNQK